MHRQEAAGRLVDVHGAVCADNVCAHQPAQLDEQPVRIGVLLLRAVELSHALGGLLVAPAHAMQELIDPPLAGTDVDSFCVAPTHSRTETRRMCSWRRVMSAGDSKVFLPSGAARGALRFQKQGVFRLTPSNLPGTRAGPRTGNAACPIAVPSSTGGTCR